MAPRLSIAAPTGVLHQCPPMAPRRRRAELQVVHVALAARVRPVEHVRRVAGPEARDARFAALHRGRRQPPPQAHARGGGQEHRHAGKEDDADDRHCAAPGAPAGERAEPVQVHGHEVLGLALVPPRVGRALVVVVLVAPARAAGVAAGRAGPPGTPALLEGGAAGRLLGGARRRALFGRRRRRRRRRRHRAQGLLQAGHVALRGLERVVGGGAPPARGRVRGVPERLREQAVVVQPLDLEHAQALPQEDVLAGLVPLPMEGLLAEADAPGEGLHGDPRDHFDGPVQAAALRPRHLPAGAVALVAVVEVQRPAAARDAQDVCPEELRQEDGVGVDLDRPVIPQVLLLAEDRVPDVEEDPRVEGLVAAAPEGAPEGPLDDGDVDPEARRVAEDLVGVAGEDASLAVQLQTHKRHLAAVREHHLKAEERGRGRRAPAEQLARPLRLEALGVVGVEALARLARAPATRPVLVLLVALHPSDVAAARVRAVVAVRGTRRVQRGQAAPVGRVGRRGLAGRADVLIRNRLEQASCFLHLARAAGSAPTQASYGGQRGRCQQRPGGARARGGWSGHVPRGACA
eukprot:CAMPEP_0179248492 /NCGR_PEP_ID=MMETSP0797-20121207/20153_1 /TAXON_ID=47934 /ORGANISM="Dinophysis acuminata, Strain DAEP01" /LENGTH=575 /DNA_ID=CAMNT_0020956145 /DNA_START=133 /DNA_END=1857 /DNA_ORIENTATION=+